MADVAEQFVLLKSSSSEISGNKLVTRGIGLHVDCGEIRLGLDASGLKHLLLPVGGATFRPDVRSRGVTLSRLPLIVDGSEVVFADLHCRIATLGLVFDRLVDDVLKRVNVGGLAPVDACHVTLDEWRAMLQTAGEELSRETLLGLTGELEVLRLICEKDPRAAMAAWTGPRKTVHDFVAGTSALEVKCTASVDGNSVSISNIDQLDPNEVGVLHLTVVHCKEDPRAPSLDDRIRGLIDLGVPRDELIKAVSAAGYVFESASTGCVRYRVRNIRAWRVDDKFPGLRRHDIAENRRRGVSKIKYELALDSAPPKLSDDEAESLLREWLDNE